MGEANASFGDSQNFSEETSNSTTCSSGPPKKNNRRRRESKEGQSGSRKRNSSQKERNCICDLCDFSTAYSFSLMRHKEKVHKQVGGGESKVKVKAEAKVKIEVKPPPPAPVQHPPPPPPPPVQHPPPPASHPPKVKTPDPVVLPSMFSPPNRADFLDLQNFANPISVHENAQWSIPNPPASTSIKFETTDGIPINLFESNFTPINQGEFITFRKAEDAGNNVVETLMNGYTDSGFPPQLPGPLPPSLPTYNDRSLQVTGAEKYKIPRPTSVPSQPVKPRIKETVNDVSTKGSKKGGAKKVTNRRDSSAGGESSNNISKKKSAKKSKSQKSSNDAVDNGEADKGDAKRKRSQARHVKIMITSIVSQCPLCSFASKYPSNTGRHFYGIHKDEYNKVLRGELQIEGIKYREEKTKKVKEVKKAPTPLKNMVELKIPQVSAPIRHDFENPPILVPQNTIAPTAAQELEQFVQQENLEMFASGEPDNLDLSTEPMASFIESLLSSSIEPSDWNLSHVESQYPQPSSSFTPAMNNNFGHPNPASNVVPPVPPQVPNIPVNYMHQYHEIPQVPVMAHTQLQQIQTITVPVTNFTASPALKVEQNLLPTPQPQQGNKRSQKRKASAERQLAAVRPNSKSAEVTEEEKEEKRKKALERKRELRKQKKLQKEAEKLVSSDVATATVAVAGTLDPQVVPVPVVNQTGWSSQYFQIPNNEQTFPGHQTQNHPTHFDSMKNEGIAASHIQSSYLQMPMQSPVIKTQPEQFPVLDHNMVISQPTMSPAPPVLSMATQVSMNTPHSMSEAVFYDNHIQTLPTLAPEYPSPPQLTHMPDYGSQMNVSHVNDFLSPPKLTHSTGFPSPPGLSHTSQYSNLSSPVCVATPMDYQSPSTLQGLSDSMDSTNTKNLPVGSSARRKKSELSQEEIDAARQKRLAKRREVDAARRRQKLEQQKSQMGLANVSLQSSSNVSERAKTEIKENPSAKQKIKRPNARKKKSESKVATSDPIDSGRSPCTPKQEIPELEMKTKSVAKSKAKATTKTSVVDANATTFSKLRLPSEFSTPSTSAKSDLAGTAKLQGLTPAEIDIEKRKEKKREQNRRYIMKKRLMAKAAAQVIHEKALTPTRASENSCLNSLHGHVQKSSSDPETQMCIKNENEPTHSINGNEAASSYSSNSAQTDVYKSSTLPMESMKILDFQHQFLCPLPIQETQAIEAFAFSNTPPMPGPSSFSSPSWRSHVKSEEFPLENPDARLESFSNHLNQPLNYDTVIQSPPSKKIKGKKPILSPEEKETKKKIMSEKRKEQRRLKNELKRHSVKVESGSCSVGEDSNALDTYLPLLNMASKSLDHESGGLDKKFSSPKPQSCSSLQKQQKQKVPAEMNERKQQAREKQREKRRQTAELKRKEKEKQKERKKGDSFSESVQQVAFVEMNKPVEMQHCSFQDCDFKTDSKYKLIVHTTFHDALTNMPPLVRSMLEATGNIDFLMKLQPERDPFNGCLIAKTEDLAINRSDAVSTGAPG